jgi:hypothetical protein
MSQDYSPSLVTKNLVFCGDAAMKSAAGPATLLYDKVNDNNGTMYNGSCLDFDGTDDYVTVGSSGMNASTTALTTSMWISFDAMSDSWILANLSIADYTKGYLVRVDHPSYQVGFYVGKGSSSNSVWSTNTLSLSTWYHIVCTYKSGEQLIYVNGVVWASGTGTGSIDYTGITTGYIGVASDLSRDFNGQIANLMIYDTVLSAANVKELYDDSKVIIPTKNDASGGFVAQTNLKCWFPMSEGAGEYVYDGSGNGSDGTIVNASTNKWLTGQTGAPQLVEGYNRKLLFSGDDYVDCGNNSSLNFTTSNFSISCWVYIHDLTDVGYIVRRGGWGSNGWYTYLDTSGRIQIYTNDSGQGDPHTQTISNSSVITANTWHHVVWVRNGATGVIYVDGTDETSSGDSMIDPASSPANCYIGSTTNYISGIVDEVIVYDTVVTSSQAAALHATDANGGPLPPDPMSGASSLPSTSNVVSYWRNEGSGTWTDRGNNSNDGTPAGTPTTLLFKQGINGSKNVNTGRDGQGFPLRCQNNGAIGFKDGSNDHVTIPTSMDFQVSTLLLWVKFTELGRYFISSTGASPGYYQWYVYADGKLQFEYSRTETGVAASSIVGTAGDIVADTWYHLGVILDSGGATGTMYKDGNLLKQSAWSTTGALTPTSIYAGPTSNSFGGQIANVQIYNRALTYAEIQQNYKSFKTRFGK